MLTVVTPATVTRLTTADAVLVELGTASDFSTYDELRLQDVVDQATSMVQDYCGRVFARETVREAFHDEVDAIVLRRTPIVSVASVTEYPETALTSSDYEYFDTAGILHRVSEGLRMSWMSWPVTVQYTGGYLLPGQSGRNLPYAVERATILLAKTMLAGSGRDPGIRSEDVPGIGSTSYWMPGASDILPSPEAERMLRPYRRVGIA